MWDERRGMREKRGNGWRYPGQRGESPSISPTAFPSVRSLFSRSFLLFHHVGWEQASAPATAATDWPATATHKRNTTVENSIPVLPPPFAAGVAEWRIEEGKSYYFYCVLCKRINSSCSWVMLACILLLHSRWLYVTIYFVIMLHTLIIWVSKLGYDILYCVPQYWMQMLINIKSCIVVTNILFWSVVSSLSLSLSLC